MPPPAVLGAAAGQTRRGGRDGGGGADLRLAQLLCARVCHDLIGAAGAIETGVDLLAEESADRADICDLIGLSGRQLNRRLAFYRLAFGMAGSASDTRPLAEAKRLAAGFLDGGRVGLRWQLDGASVEEGRIGAGETRLLLCAILVAAEGLHRGGSLTVRVDRTATCTVVAIEAEGRDAAIAEAVSVALVGGAELDAVTARTVPAYYLGLQLRALAAELDVSRTAAGFSVRIAAPCA
jgi:histidine phosphotransferase ChpT